MGVAMAMALFVAVGVAAVMIVGAARLTMVAMAIALFVVVALTTGDYLHEVVHDFEGIALATGLEMTPDLQMTRGV
jgi:hypothetical protein